MPVPRSLTAAVLLDPGQPRDERWVVVCSWCDSLKDEPQGWTPLGEVRLECLRVQQHLPRVTHGICESCADALLAQRVPA